ncbi:TPA: hypothetical protein DCL30_01175 [Candidatus Peribacteria bacterium]|nr:MAG: hypothetical protein A2529_05915 [Candidatus Peribacteria bacterium RIFOXYD2_FULL_58_15]HAI98139.1 hypothetical protein [Candidatus Peribacteria bacterium]HAS34580.1 hypothetical protein [Candidatus Peribacteria bacterium]
MIEVHYSGGLGNVLFQYCFARVLAGQLGYALEAKPVPGFPHTADRIDGKRFPGGAIVVLEGHKVDLPAILADTRDRKIIVKGCFQRYEYYHSFREQIRTWMQPACSAAAKPDPRALVMHVRRGDYLRVEGYPLPFSFYKDVLKRADFDHLVICTDDPRDPFFRKFRHHDPEIKSGDLLEDFCFLKSAKKIALSQSTYSWWAAYLSDATEIYFPRSLTGPFSSSRPDIDLEVDEPRYRYVQCREPYTFSFGERMAQLKKSFLYHIKHLLAFVIPEALRRRVRRVKKVSPVLFR